MPRISFLEILCPVTRLPAKEEQHAQFLTTKHKNYFVDSILCRYMLNSMVKSVFKISNNERNTSFLIGDQYRPTNSGHSINDLQNTRITPQKQERGNNFRSAVIGMTWGVLHQRGKLLLRCSLRERSKINTTSVLGQNEK